MGIIAKLYADGQVYNVLQAEHSIIQRSDETGRPISRPFHTGLKAVIEATKDSYFFEKAIHPTQQIQEIILEYTDSMLGSRTRKVRFVDCHVTFDRTDFKANGRESLTETLLITAAGIEDSHSQGKYTTPRRVTEFLSEEIPVTGTETPQTTITRIMWNNDGEQEENITEIKYAQKVSLIAQIENPMGSTAIITIEKEDGTEFENGKTQLSFTEEIAEEGFIEITPFEIQERWEEFKTADIDKLIAKVEHGGVSRESAALQIIPPPKVLVNFRTGNGYKGEYGFDWLRMADTGKKGDVFYKDIIGSYATSNFVQSDAEYVKLGKKFEMPQHPIKANDKYVVPVLALLPTKKATLTLKVEVKDADAQKIEYKYDKTYFKLDKSEVSHKTLGKKELADDLTIECIKEFTTDQFIEVEADGKFAGKLKVLANDKANRYKAEIVFVQVWTDIISSGTPNKPVLSKRDSELKKYMAQALAKPSFNTVTLDLSSDATFNTSFSSAGNIINGSSDAIQDHMNTALYAKYDPLGKDYRKHYKIYFINESAGGLYGRSYGIPSANRSVVVYAIGFNDSTLAHETFHAMGLYHSFSDKSAFTFEKNKTDNIMDYSDIATPPVPVISTWQWQWTELWKNLDKE
ncbi:reprolysin-like metallo-peptidase family M12B [Aquimarina sp. MAR_2010_214]|uniref:type VI secretion system tube protein TssD n=1 Tax=Aquimarina sp. MAR_2010_214 TaxID=1250026 RepID=UPI000C6FE1A1|nr:type VI secretion system tube protein TssD [Aquimarina sp. MAR_2010_214]PKV53130.1 reprolysin-like metallo-peptidase family M12B [Aquimarina sp. MAR_2010_214]